MIFYFIIFYLGNRCLGTNFMEHEMELVCVCKNPFHIGFYGETKTLFFEWENKHITRTRTVPLLPSHNTPALTVISLTITSLSKTTTK